MYGLIDVYEVYKRYKKRYPKKPLTQAFKDIYGASGETRTLTPLGAGT